MFWGRLFKAWAIEVLLVAEEAGVGGWGLETWDLMSCRL